MHPIVSAAAMDLFASDKLSLVHGPLNIKAVFPSDMSNLQYTGQYVAEPGAMEAKFVVLITPRPISEKQLKKIRKIRNTEGFSNPCTFTEFLGNPTERGVTVFVSKNVGLKINWWSESLSLAVTLKAPLVPLIYLACVLTFDFY